MKASAISIVLLVSIVGVSAQLVTNQPARLKFKLVSFEGKIGSGASNSTICPTPEALLPGNGGGDTVTTPGRESDLQWKFVGRDRDRDVYDFTFTRATKTGSTEKTTTSKQVQFDGKQAVVFQDDLHTVVMESPTGADLSASRH